MMFKAKMFSGDFEENSMTFIIEGKMILQSGDYVILTKDEYEKLKNGGLN